MFRFCLPKINGRGAGLGNELIPWAKAFIASQELGLTLLHPAWGLNPRGYHYYFGTSRFDWVWPRALKTVLPVFTFSESDYRRFGGVDFAVAVKAFAEEQGLLQKNTFVLEIEGMWGGYHCILNARDFVMKELYRTRHINENLYDIRKRLPVDKVIVAVHVRRGDFAPVNPECDYRGKFNISLPMSWYRNVCRTLQESLGDRISFLLLTDGEPEELNDFIIEFDPVTTFHQKKTAISDLLALTQADLLVCSVSSYSMWAAFLSNKPYIWYEPSLQNVGGWRSLWGHEKGQKAPFGITAKNVIEREKRNDSKIVRGSPVGDDGKVPAKIVDQLKVVFDRKQLCSDLVNYGVVR